jgi:hypothetical protein
MSDKRTEWNGASGCSEVAGAPRCGCGEQPTRLTGLCEKCWKQRPALAKNGMQEIVNGPTEGLIGPQW